jgi:dipeptidyl aminopeptidase/acylaminoacyl peptidase
VALPGGAFSPDGRRLVARGFDQKQRVWEVATGKELGILDGGDPKGAPQETSTCVTAFAWTPDGTELASLTLTARACWEATSVTGDAVGTIFLPGDLTAAAKSLLRVWDVDSGRMVRQWQVPDTALALAVAPDGRTVAVASTKALHLWEKASCQERWHCRATAVALAFSPDGRLLATAEGDRIRIRDVRDGRERAHFAGHQAAVRALAFTPDGKALVSAGADSTALVWDVAGLGEDARPEAPALDAAALEQRWRDLEGEDAGRAYQAILTLAGSPRQSVGWLREHLRPATAPEARRVQALLADLDADAFETRDRAARELANLGGLVRTSLEKALLSRPSTEKRRRLEALLEELKPALAPLSGENLRQVRAVEVLERAATPEARRLLEQWAGGARETLLTGEARVALRRH